MRPIPVYIIPSHVYLSAEDQVKLFGSGHAMTILEDHIHAGQYVYQEKVNVSGRLKRDLDLHVLGPNWKRSHVELTPTEAVYLGYKLDEVKTGSLLDAAPITITGPNGSVDLDHGVIIPKPHMTCNIEDARRLNLANGDRVAVEILGDHLRKVEEAVVRVHPTFSLSVELHQDYARGLWVNHRVHAHIIS